MPNADENTIPSSLRCNRFKFRATYIGTLFRSRAITVRWILEHGEASCKIVSNSFYPDP